MKIELSKDQLEATNKILSWIKNPTKQVFTMTGFAGTGKTTIAAYIRQFIDLEVAFVSFTAKAVSVLRNKLKKQDVLKANDEISTIHRLIYKPFEGQNGKIYFRKVHELSPDLKLIVADEASMIGSKIFDDLTFYNKPILFIGDLAQLPPVEDVPILHLENPDVQLTKIHRQAENNPIIMFSKAIREGTSIKEHLSDNVILLNSEVYTHSQYFNHLKKNYNVNDDIFLCGFNKTRVNLNQEIRSYLGFQGDPKKDDKIICLKNNYEAGIFNGMIGFVKKCKKKITKGEEVFELTADFDGEIYEGLALARQFNSQRTLLNEKTKHGTYQKTEFDLFDYGYGISVHKSQGSEFKNVVIAREKCNYWDQKKWDYTAVTRAIDKVTMLL